jgi:transposase
MSEITLLAIDTAKSVFELLGLDGSGQEVFRRKNLRRSKLLKTVAKLAPCEVVMEACGASHHWGRCFEAMGHRVRLIAPQFVKPYRRGQKNDARDVEAIASAAGAPKMRFVGVKTASAQAIQALHRVRRRIVREKVSISNQLRGLLAEHGEVFAKGDTALRQGLRRVLAEGSLPPLLLELVEQESAAFDACVERLKHYDRRNQQLKRSCPQASTLERSLPGVGPLTATATVAKIADPHSYRNGREFAASLGFPPRQYGTGGKVRLGKMSKQGDRYLRTLYIHGARSVLRHLGDKQDDQSCWLRSLMARRGFNIACVALAHRNARRSWAILAGRTQPSLPPEPSEA